MTVDPKNNPEVGESVEWRGVKLNANQGKLQDNIIITIGKT